MYGTKFRLLALLAVVLLCLPFCSVGGNRNVVEVADELVSFEVIEVNHQYGVTYTTWKLDFKTLGSAITTTKSGLFKVGDSYVIHLLKTNSRIVAVKKEE